MTVENKAEGEPKRMSEEKKVRFSPIMILRRLNFDVTLTYA
jgi:hypothetical protein